MTVGIGAAIRTAEPVPVITGNIPFTASAFAWPELVTDKTTVTVWPWLTCAGTAVISEARLAPDCMFTASPTEIFDVTGPKDGSIPEALPENHSEPLPCAE